MTFKIPAHSIYPIPDIENSSSSLKYSQSSHVPSFLEQKVGAPQNTVKFVVPWMTFVSKEEQMRYDEFIRSEVRLHIFWLLMVPLAIQTAMGCIATFNANYSFFHQFSHGLRLVLFISMFLYIWSIKSDIPSKKFNLCSVTLGNAVIILQSLTGGLVLISRTMVGHCTPNGKFYFVACNHLQDKQVLPLGSLLILVFVITVIPIACKTHRWWAVVLGFMISATCGVVAIYIGNLTSTAHIPAIVITLLQFLVIYQHDYNYIKAYVGIVNLEMTLRSKMAAENDKDLMAMQSKELRHLIGNVAHDLKTPVQGFLMELDNLEAATSIQSKKSSVRSLRSTCSFMTMMINRAIDYTKANAGMTLIPSMETVDISSTIKWVKNCVGKSPLGVPVLIDPFDARMCNFVITDKQWLMENLLCLLSNAMKFSIEGSISVKCKLIVAGADKSNNWPKRLASELINAIPSSPKPTSGKGRGSFDGSTNASLRSSPNSKTGKRRGSGTGTFGSKRASSDVSIRSTPSFDESNSMLRFEVEDSGVGIPEEERKALFQPFKQAQRRAGGTGLGLYSLSKRIESIGGEFGVCDRSDGNSGSCFWFTIPYRPDSTMDGGDGTDYECGKLLDFEEEQNHRSGRSVFEEEEEEKSSEELLAEQLPDRTLSAMSAMKYLHDESESGSSSAASRSTSGPNIAEIERAHLAKRSSSDISDGEMDRRQSVQMPKVSIIQSTSGLKESLEESASRIRKLQQLDETSRILIVDDSIPIQKTTSRALKRAGFVVDIATNGAHCLNILYKENKTYDVILMDLQMPVLDGIQTVKRIRHQDQKACGSKEERFIIGLSANSDNETQEEALGVGMDAFIAKPLSVKLLTECCKRKNITLKSSVVRNDI